jgi:hypothetical protein
LEERAMNQEDIGSHLHYDEQVAIETYVLRNCQHLLTDPERAILEGGLAQWWAENLERMHEWGARTRVALVAPPWEPAPFDAAHAEQVRGIVRRLQADHGEDLQMLRCARCSRVGRGPGDAFCPWCRASAS